MEASNAHIAEERQLHGDNLLVGDQQHPRITDDSRTTGTRHDSMECTGTSDSHDDWKDYSCATPWEYFVNDLENAMRQDVHPTSLMDRESSGSTWPRKEVAYNGHLYVLRMLHRQDYDKVKGGGGLLCGVYEG